MNRVAVYLRTSTQEQHPENQLPEIQAYCQTHGLEIVRIYQEQESAWKSGRQVELRRLLADCQDGRPFDILVCWSLDRLSRQGIANILNLITMLRLCSVKVVSLRESWMETDGPMQELLLAVFGWAAQYESRIKSERTLAGLARARAEGKKLGRPAGSRDKAKRNRRGYYQRWANKPIKKGGHVGETKNNAAANMELRNK